jgi:hypothetical protein
MKNGTRSAASRIKIANKEARRDPAHEEHPCGFDPHGRFENRLGAAVPPEYDGLARTVSRGIE